MIYFLVFANECGELWVSVNQADKGVRCRPDRPCTLDIYNPSDHPCDLYAFYRGEHYSGVLEVRGRKSIRYICEDRRREGFFYEMREYGSHLIIHPSTDFLECRDLEQSLLTSRLIVVIVLGSILVVLLGFAAVQMLRGRPRGLSVNT
jgi:hypothetical protein